jgi:hypothetical protein
MDHQLAGVFPSWSGGRGTDHDPAWRAAVVMRGDVLLERQLVNFQLPLTSTGRSFLR